MVLLRPYKCRAGSMDHTCGLMGVLKLLGWSSAERAFPPLLRPRCQPGLLRPPQVSLVGHSAGAHMCTMALLHRALAASKAVAAAEAEQAAVLGSSTTTSSSGAEAAPQPAAAAQEQEQAPGAAAVGAMGAEEEEAAHADSRMPRRLVAMAGVYDIAKHFEYEEGERLAELAVM